MLSSLCLFFQYSRLSCRKLWKHDIIHGCAQRLHCPVRCAILKHPVKWEETAVAECFQPTSEADAAGYLPRGVCSEGEYHGILCEKLL